jgi:hypothetical protein
MNMPCLHGMYNMHKSGHKCALPTESGSKPQLYLVFVFAKAAVCTKRCYKSSSSFFHAQPCKTELCPAHCVRFWVVGCCAVVPVFTKVWPPSTLFT